MATTHARTDGKVIAICPHLNWFILKQTKGTFILVIDNLDAFLCEIFFTTMIGV